VRDLRAKLGKKPHGTRFSLTAKVTMAEQAITAISFGLPRVKDPKELVVELKRLRIIADMLTKLLAKYRPKISAA
jgi:glycine cleavage system regulatory protein